MVDGLFVAPPCRASDVTIGPRTAMTAGPTIGDGPRAARSVVKFLPIDDTPERVANECVRLNDGLV